MRGRVVFDVNILVSAVLAPESTPARALEAAVERRWTIVSSPHIVSKLIEVLSRPRFDGRLTNRSLNDFLGGYQAFSTVCTPDPSVKGVADDEEDDRVLGTGVAGRADIIVTGDKGLLAIGSFVGIPIVTARTFLNLVDA